MSNALRKIKRNKKQNGKFIKFICPECNYTEDIPTDIVEFLDASDQIDVDTSIPPRFDCQRCNGKMIPIHYTSVNGITHTYNK